MTPDDPAATLLPLLLSLVGPHTAKIILAVCSWVAVCSLVASAILNLVPPPPAGGWRARLWRVLTVIALARGYLTPAYQPDRTSIVVPRDKASELRGPVAKMAGISREETKP